MYLKLRLGLSLGLSLADNFSCYCFTIDDRAFNVEAFLWGGQSAAFGGEPLRRCCFRRALKRENACGTRAGERQFVDVATAIDDGNP